MAVKLLFQGPSLRPTVIKVIDSTKVDADLGPLDQPRSVHEVNILTAFQKQIANTSISIEKALKPFIGYICLFLALHSTNHMLTFHWQLLFKCQLTADVVHPPLCKLIYCPQKLVECSPTMLAFYCLHPFLCCSHAEPCSSQSILYSCCMFA